MRAGKHLQAHPNSRLSAASFSPGSLAVSARGTTETPRARSSVRNSSAALSARLIYPWLPASTTGRAAPRKLASGTTRSGPSCTCTRITTLARKPPQLLTPCSTDDPAQQCRYWEKSHSCW